MRRLSVMVLVLAIGTFAAVQAEEPNASPAKALVALPGDATVAVHISGVRTLRKAISDSEFGKLCAEEEVRSFFKPAWNECLERYLELRKSARVLPDLGDLEKAFAGEIAFSLTLPDAPDAPPIPAFCAVIQVGDAEAAARVLAPILRGQPLEEGKLMPLPLPLPGGPPAFVYEKGLLLIASTANHLASMRVRLAAAAPADSLVSAPGWMAAQKLLGRSGHATVFIAPAPLLKVIAARAGSANAEQTKAVIEKCSLNSLHAFSLQAGTRGPALSLDTAIVWDSPPGTVVSQVLSPQPIPLTALKTVPIGAPFCSASHVDLAAGLSLLRTLLPAHEREEFEAGLANAHRMLGVDVEKEILPLVGPTLVLYHLGGSEWMGLLPEVALSTSIKNPDAFGKALDRMLGTATQAIAANAGGMGPTLELRTVSSAGVPIRYLSVSTLPFSPSLAIVQDRLLVTLSVSSMKKALRQLSAPSDITAAPEFKEALERLIGKPLNAENIPGPFSFSNPHATPSSGNMLAAVGQIAQGALNMQMRRQTEQGGGNDSAQQMALDLLNRFDFALYPSDEVFARHVRSTANITLKEAGGTVLRSDLAIPGTQLLGSGGGGIFVASVGAGLVLPVLARARESARRTACASNLSQMGKACTMFADVAANEGKYPKRLEDLFDAYIIDKRVFLCPSVTVHGEGHGAVDHCDYIYLPGSDPTHGVDVIAFCRKGNHGHRGQQSLGRNVLLGAGAVEWVTDEEAFKKHVLETLKGNGISLDLPAAGPAPAITPVLTQKLQAAVRELGSEDFTARDAAMKSLTEAGASARAPLEEGAKAQDAEIQNRCKQILARLDANKNLGADGRAWVEELRKELGLDEAKKEE